MKKMKKYKGSFAVVREGKTATFGFKEYQADTIKSFAKLALQKAWVPVTVKNGHRTYDAVTEIHNWLRFDCDVDGEKETILSILEGNGLAYMCLPSTNYNPKTKPYKWHISVPTRKASQDVVKYKWQMKQALIDLGIDLHDRRVTEVCVQNFNPYKNGRRPKEGWRHSIFKDGNKLTLKKAPKDLAYSEMTKTVFNGRGSNAVIPKKVVSAKGNIEILHPESGIKIDKVGWVQLKDLNLDVGSMIGGLSCPAHNHRHNNGKGGHQCGYAFANMDEGGDIWINCTGAECQGKYYKVDLDNYGANTKLSDLFELRKIVSLSGYNHKDNKICYIKDDGSIVHFRWKDVLKFWKKDIFFKLDMNMTERNVELMKKYQSKLKNMDMDKAKSFQKKVKLEKKIQDLKLKNEYDVIQKALSNEKQFSSFKNTYLPIWDGDTISKLPHEAYTEDIINNVSDYIQTQKQFDTLTYKIDPFALNLKGDVINNDFQITSNRILPPCPIGVPEKAIVNDYLKHNPFLMDILNMIMAQRYGANKKSSYLWLKADSNWGKTFLFEGILKGLGYTMTESEIKKALKGDASGLEVNKVSKVSLIFVDEFKSAVTELKNIASEMSITEKFKCKTIVPVFLKVFASAEEVQSLNGSIGMEEQFANRFLYIEAKGSLLDRQMYMIDKGNYVKNVRLFALQQLHKLKDMYDGRGRVGATKLADEIYTELIEKYNIKNKADKVKEVLPKKFREWLNIVIDKREKFSNFYKDVLYFTKNSVHIINLSKCKEVFINEYLNAQAGKMAQHKTSKDIFGNIKKTTIRINGSNNPSTSYMVK